MNNVFRKKLFVKVIDSIPNNYKDNHDTFRFGPIQEKTNISLKKYLIKKILNPKYIAKREVIANIEKTSDFLSDYGESFGYLYNLLNDEASKELLIDILAFRLLGEKKVKLPSNNSEYWKQIKDSYNFADKKDFIDIEFMKWRLYSTSYKKYGIPIKVYTPPPSIVVYGYLGQYEYKGSRIIAVEEDDVVLDCGGCYGDTALLFAYKAGRNGKIYSFEFIPGHIEIFKRNLALNPSVAGNIEIIKNPLWDRSGVSLNFKNNGPGSKVNPDSIDKPDGKVKTVSIDDFVLNKSISKVDFIKMDIEGAELNSLKGAINTITRFKPKLAISLYHSLEDFVKIPQYLNDLNSGYKFYIGHYTIHEEETVLYAIAV